MSQPLSVLVVDDSETARALTRHMLSFEGHEVHEARDGKDALRKLEQGLYVDMILLDLNMPRMNGLQLMEAVPGLVSRTPVFVVTVAGGKEQVERCKGLGARGFFSKPLRRDQLLRAVDAVQKLARTG